LIYLFKDNPEIMKGVVNQLIELYNLIKRKEKKMQKEINLLFSEIEKSDRDARHAVVNAVAKI